MTISGSIGAAALGASQFDDLVVLSAASLRP
jgi:hypothetical protein